MRLIVLVWTPAQVAVRLGFDEWWVRALARHRRLPVHSQKPTLFSVEAIEDWCTPENLQRYSELKTGFFDDESRPQAPGSRNWDGTRSP